MMSYREEDDDKDLNNSCETAAAFDERTAMDRCRQRTPTPPPRGHALAIVALGMVFCCWASTIFQQKALAHNHTHATASSPSRKLKGYIAPLPAAPEDTETGLETIEEEAHEEEVKIEKEKEKSETTTTTVASTTPSSTIATTTAVTTMTTSSTIATTAASTTTPSPTTTTNSNMTTIIAATDTTTSSSSSVKSTMATVASTTPSSATSLMMSASTADTTTKTSSTIAATNTVTTTMASTITTSSGGSQGSTMATVVSTTSSSTTSLATSASTADTTTKTSSAMATNTTSTASPTAPAVAKKPAWLDFTIEPYTGPPSLKTTLDLCANGKERCYSHIYRGSGIGGQVMSLFAAVLYLQKSGKRTRFIIDEARYRKYVTADGVHLMLAYFTPRMALLERKEDRTLLDRLLPGKSTYEKWSDVRHMYSNDKLPLWVGRHPGFTKERARFYGQDNGRTMDDLYHDMVYIVCQNMQFNNQTWSRIQELRGDFQFPDYLALPYTEKDENEQDGEASTSTSTSTRRVGSISFHIRRTDKVSQGKARAYPATVYLEKALAIQERDEIDLTHCFIATDDYNVIAEMRRALNAVLDGTRRGRLCRELHFTPSGGHTHFRISEDGTLVFLSELSILVETTYFVGTFSSNVGGLVGVMRACPNLPHDGTQHYAQSYGVDSDTWVYK